MTITEATAYMMLSRDDIADLYSTRDAAELADWLIMDTDDDLFEGCDENLSEVITAMILNPVD